MVKIIIMIIMQWLLDLGGFTWKFAHRVCEVYHRKDLSMYG